MEAPQNMKGDASFQEVERGHNIHKQILMTVTRRQGGLIKAEHIKTYHIR